MILKPANLDELQRLLADANARAERVSAFDLSALKRVLEHKAEDMTARVEAGVTLAALQTHLAERGQWLPLDPSQPEKLTIGALLATSPSGPRRFGYGTVRDYLIGLTAVLADGRVIHSGGNVVKNVAGYDLMKVFIGSRGSLGVIVEAIFKLRPRPEAEGFVEAKCPSLDEADKLIEAVLDSELTPVVFDLHNLGSSSHAALPVLVLGFAGTREELQWQFSRAAELGFVEPTTLDYTRAMGDPAVSFQMTSVLPSKVIEALRELSHAPFIARAGNGIIYHAGLRAVLGSQQPQARTDAQFGSTLSLHADALRAEDGSRSAPVSGAGKLAQRLKDEFDPKHILPDSPL
jgi:FAD/FMN-containing dehydrogenase